MAEPDMIALTAHHIAALTAVKDGADVYARFLASSLRDIQRINPKLVHITKAMNPPADGTQRLPYFGAIATKDGKEVLEAFRNALS